MFFAFQPALINYVYMLIGNKEASEEIINDVFLKIWDKKDSLEFGDTLKNYLFRSAKNASINHLRKNKLNTNQLDENIDKRSPFNADKLIAEQEAAKIVKDCIDILPPRCKDVFLLSRYQSKTYKEIGGIMEVSIKTVENQMGIALRNLRECFKKNKFF